MDTNLVLPLTGKDVDRCKVVFDYWLEAGTLQQAAASIASTNSARAVADGNSSSGSNSNSGHDGGMATGPASLAGAVRSALQSQFVQDSLASSHQVQVRDSRRIVRASTQPC